MCYLTTHTKNETGLEGTNWIMAYVAGRESHNRICFRWKHSQKRSQNDTVRHGCTS